MATDSESNKALSPITVDNKKGSDAALATALGKSPSNSPEHHHATTGDAPAMKSTTDESSGGDNKDDGGFDSDEQDENNAYFQVPEANYVSDSDPYIYSDDSESFSDAYFRPSFSDYPAVLYPRSTSGTFSKDELIGRRIPGALSEDDPMTPGPANPYSQQPNNPYQQYAATPNSYGSIPGTPAGQPMSDRSLSPFKMSGPFASIGSIMEDSPVDEEQQQLLNSDPNQQFRNYYGYPSNLNNPATPAEMDAQYLKQSKKERKRLRKAQKAAARQRQLQMIQNQQKQREQAMRERTVTEVKGRPQDETKCRDSCYAYIFVAQFVIILGLAINSGVSMMISNGRPSWGTLTPHSAPKVTGTSTTATSSSSSSSIPSTTSSSSSSSIPSSTSSSSSSIPSSTSSSSSSIPSTTTTKTKTNKGSRYLIERILEELELDNQPPHLRRLESDSPMLDTGSNIKTNATLKEVLMNVNDKDNLVTDDAIAPDAPGHSSSSSSFSSSAPRPSNSTDSGGGSSSGSGSSRSSSHESAKAAKPLITAPPPPSSSSEESASTDPLTFTIDYRNVIALIGISGFYACILSYLSFGFMLIMSRALIHVTLVFSILLALAWGVLGLTIDPYGIISIMGFGALLLSLGYTIYNWQRVPFASTNLHAALSAMRCTSDITFLGMLAALVAFLWVVIWAMAFVGTVDNFNPAQCTNESVCLFQVPLTRIGLYGFFLVSFYWTNSVIKNVLRVTVASAIGTWWYYPQEISPVCSPAVGQPLVRSLTKSLGSICLGSLFSQPLQLTNAVLQCFCCMSNCWRGEGEAESKEVGAGTEIDVGAPSPSPVVGKPLGDANDHDSNRNVFAGKLRCWNRWAYTYIGMYGYGFCEGGEKAIQLFEAREWMEVVRDNLIPNVLLMASIVIGGSTGSFAVLAEEVDGYDFTTFHKPITTAFVIGSILGFVLSNILLLGVVGSAVNTILVCFAAGPFEFDRNHPRLSREMREVWSQQVWEPSA